MSPTAKILAWSSGRPAWQQDALRQLASIGVLSDHDIDDLLTMLKAEHGLVSPDSAAAAVPLAANHLPDTAAHEEEVTLLAISDVDNVNNLKPSKPLQFAPAGLTLIVGDNGTGKSGYARILKRATRARGQEKRVLPNVFDANYAKAQPASASIHVRIAVGGSERDEVLAWKDHQPAADLLARIRVFDSRAAAVYVSERCDVQFEPFNLDLLLLLAQVLGRLAQKIKTEMSQLETRCRELADSIPDEGTARTFIDELPAKTSTAELDEATRWDAESARRISNLEGILKGAEARTVEFRSGKARCERLAELARRLEAGLSEAACERYRLLRADSIEKRGAADKLSKEAFKDEPLSGVGEGPWRVMWQAAKQYSLQAVFPARSFPLIESKDARCMLCQQEIGVEAKGRFIKFRDFMQGEVAGLAQEAETEFAKAKSDFDTLEAAQTDEHWALVEEMGRDNPDLLQSVTDFLTIADDRRRAVATALEGGDFSALPPAPDDISGALSGYGESFEEKAQAMDGVLDQEERVQLEAEYERLKGRKTLSEHRNTITRLVSHFDEISKLEACRKSLNTKSITDAKKVLEDKVLIKPFRQTLEEELDRLSISHKVTLGFSGEQAITYHRAQFVGTDYASLVEVLSEGEHRAVALACFFAEARQLPGKPPLVIDDPVSSLDHLRRERVARRIVEEARERQVVVMTHDLLFHADVVAKAAELQVPLRRYSLVRTQDGCGSVDSGEPWPVKDVVSRLHHLEQEHTPELVRLFEAQDPTYRGRARAVGQMLRETWERLVEEDLFGSVVMRFRRSVNTLRLTGVDVQDDAWQEIHWGMARTSIWAHDQPAGTGDPPPTPTDLREEIGRIRGSHRELRRAWEQVEARRKKLLKPPSA